MTHYLRSKHDAILVGVGTVLADDPKLNCRIGDHKIRPVVLDPNGKWDYSKSTLRRLTKEGGLAPIILTKKRKNDGAQYIELDSFEWDCIFQALHNHGITSVMVEGGAKVINSLLQSRFDSLIVTVGPVYLGDGGVQVSPPQEVRLGSVNWWVGQQDSVMMAKASHP